MASLWAFIVGGGGGASSNTGGGGGGGGVLENTSYTITAGAKTVTVGDGGDIATNGGNSVFDSLTAIGGGGGIDYGNGTDGGSGGGGGWNGGTGGAGTPGQGNTGGTGNGGHNAAGGGGGAGAVGGNAISTRGGLGGDGVPSSISGTPTYYGGGGGGGPNNNFSQTMATGGQGGGGNSSDGSTDATAGTVNTGGGGGGGGNVSHTAGKAGGSGIVIIAYKTDGSDGVSTSSTGGTVTTSGAYTIHTFTSDGTFNCVLAATTPTVETDAASDISYYSATANGNVTDVGGSSLIEKGVVFDTASHGDPGNVAPTASAYPYWNKLVTGLTTGAYDLPMTGLSAETLYYFRAYARNSDGYAYGDELSFTTLAIPYAISGVVKLNGTGVSGATVLLIRESDDTVVDTTTTDSDGVYSFADLDGEETYHVAVEYETGGQKYNALSLWGVSPVDVS